MVAKKRKSDLKVTKVVSKEGQWKEQTEESEAIDEEEGKVEPKAKARAGQRKVEEKGEDEVHQLEETQERPLAQQQQHRLFLKEQEAQQQLFVQSLENITKRTQEQLAAQLQQQKK